MQAVFSTCICWHFNILQKFLTFTAHTCYSITAQYFPEVQDLLLSMKKKKAPAHLQCLVGPMLPSSTSQTQHLWCVKSTAIISKHAEWVYHAFYSLNQKILRTSYLGSIYIILS